MHAREKRFALLHFVEKVLPKFLPHGALADFLFRPRASAKLAEALWLRTHPFTDSFAATLHRYRDFYSIIVEGRAVT